MKRLILLTVEYQGKQLTVLAEDEIDEVAGGQFPFQTAEPPGLTGASASTLETLESFRNLLLSSDDDLYPLPESFTRH